ncbi:MAG: hypothetical protein PHU68_02380 [Paludibacter sp.]|nr:hypothetical protein [Paludibacter sp.]
MQKTTPFNSTDFTTMTTGPSDQTIQRILQFAANYRSQKISNGQYVDIILS